MFIQIIFNFVPPIYNIWFTQKIQKLLSKNNYLKTILKSFQISFIIYFEYLVNSWDTNAYHSQHSLLWFEIKKRKR